MTADPMAELEAAINKIDSLEAKDLLRSQAKLIKAKLDHRRGKSSKDIMAGE